MEKVLTIKEMRSAFDSEWLLIEEPETSESLEVLRGRVSFHSKDRDEVYRKAVQLRPKRFATLFTGSLPDDTAIVL